MCSSDLFKTIDTMDIDVGGTLVWAAGDAQLNNNATLDIESTGTLDMQADQSLFTGT